MVDLRNWKISLLSRKVFNQGQKLHKLKMENKARKFSPIRPHSRTQCRRRRRPATSRSWCTGRQIVGCEASRVSAVRTRSDATWSWSATLCHQSVLVKSPRQARNRSCASCRWPRRRTRRRSSSSRADSRRIVCTTSGFRSRQNLHRNRAAIWGNWLCRCLWRRARRAQVVASRTHRARRISLVVKTKLLVEEVCFK